MAASRGVSILDIICRIIFRLLGQKGTLLCFCIGGGGPHMITTSCAGMHWHEGLNRMYVHLLWSQILSSSFGYGRKLLRVNIGYHLLHHLPALRVRQQPCHG